MTPKPEPIEILAQNIPLELQRGKYFVGWNWVWNERLSKWDKPPCNIVNGGLASSTDPKTWCNFAAAIRAYIDGKFDGIGRIPSDSLVGIDFDNCRDPETGKINTLILEKVKRLGSYTEITPSHTGLRTWVKSKLPEGWRKKGDLEVYDGKTKTGKTGGRYFTLTGQHLAGTPTTIEKRQAELEAFHKENAPEKPASVVKNDTTQPTHNIEDVEIIERALAANDGGKFRDLWEGNTSGYPSHSESDLAMCNKLAFWVGADPQRINALFRQSGLMREKWSRDDYRERTINAAIANTTDTYQPEELENHSAWVEDEEDAPHLQVVEPTKQVGDKKSLEFPRWIMTGVAGDFADLYASYLEVPKHFFWTAFLTCLGTTIADMASLASEVSPEPRPYVVLLGESAFDRKSTGIDKTVTLYQEAVDGFQVCWGVGSAEGLQKRLNQNKRLLLCLDEFKQFVNKCKIEASVLLPCVNSLFESTRYESSTKKSDICLKDVHLTLLAASTIHTYENTWSSQFTDIGFNNRLFIVPGTGEKKHSFPAKVPSREKYLFKQRIGEILKHVGGNLELDMTSEGRAMFHQWYMNMERSIHAKRLDGYAMRFMILLAVNELKAIVDEETVNQAIALCDWQLKVRRLHDPIDADTSVAKMEEKIRRSLDANGPLKDWQLKQKVHAHRAGLWIYKTAKNNLQQGKEVFWNKKTKQWHR